MDVLLHKSEQAVNQFMLQLYKFECGFMLASWFYESDYLSKVAGLFFLSSSVVTHELSRLFYGQRESNEFLSSFKF